MSKAKEVSIEEYEKLKKLNGGRPPKGYRNPYLKGKDLAANPQNRTTSGARKSIQTIINRLKSSDFEAIDKKSLMEIYKLMFNTPYNELNKIANDKDTPWGFKIIFDNLKDEKTRHKAWMEYQTWLFGKAPDAGDVNKHKDDIDFENLSPEEKKAVMTLMKNNNDRYSETGT